MAYGDEDIYEEQVKDPQQLHKLIGKWPVLWINVDGLGDEKILRQLGKCFGLHRLALEDVVSVHQRPKIEQYDKNLFVVLRMLTSSEAAGSEQFGMFLGEHLVLTFQERPSDCLDPVRERIRQRRGRIRQSGADYLVYALMDVIIDHYFPALEQFGNRLDELEDRILDRAAPDVIEQVHTVKKELLVLRRAVWPTREVVNTLLRDSIHLIKDDTQPYLRDCYDHTIQIIDMLDNQREMAASLTDLYMSSVSNRMNEIMKVLTMIATLFIPLSFIAGLYGMNFDTNRSPLNMPELRWYLGYPFVLTLMAAVVAGQIMFFRRKGWLGSSRNVK